MNRNRGWSRHSLYVVAGLLAASTAMAQGGHPGHDKKATPDSASTAHEAMAGHMASGPHMRMTPARPRTVADSVHAMAIADTLRRALARYADPAVAERDGYKLFAPQIKNQKNYHYTKWSSALAEAFRFNPAKPTSILYTRDSASGKLKLLGAMYSMPKRASLARLNDRVPLSVTEWHLHTNLCAPREGEEDRWFELKDGKPLFGLQGTIADQRACDAAGAKFHDVIFGRMVHANVFAGTDLKSVWSHEESGADHAHPGVDHRQSSKEHKTP